MLSALPAESIRPHHESTRPIRELTYQQIESSVPCPPSCRPTAMIVLLARLSVPVGFVLRASDDRWARCRRCLRWSSQRLGRWSLPSLYP